MTRADTASAMGVLPPGAQPLPASVTAAARAVAPQPAVHDLIVVERVEHNGVGIALLCFNRPEQRNPIDRSTIRALKDALVDLLVAGGPAAVVITGAGDTFSAGGDLKGYQTLYRDNDAFSVFMQDFSDVCNMIEKAAKPVLAMINGTCVAGGLEIALACDFITIADSARIGDGHLRFAQLPGAGGSQRLVRAIGVQRARHWLLTGKLFPAAHAVESGLAVLAAPPDELRRQTFDLAADVATLTPLGVGRMKELIAIAQDAPLERGLDLETALVYEYATTSHDATEGLHAFAERRPPSYKGC